MKTNLNKLIMASVFFLAIGFFFAVGLSQGQICNPPFCYNPSTNQLESTQTVSFKPEDLKIDSSTSNSSAYTLSDGKIQGGMFVGSLSKGETGISFGTRTPNSLHFFTDNIDKMILNTHGDLSIEGGLQLTSMTSQDQQPECTDKIRGMLWFTRSLSGADQLEVCLKDSSDKTAWQQVGGI